jgi:hypothetical protein
MSKPQFELGERVFVLNSSLSGPATACRFSVMECYPVSGQASVYRLRNLENGFERVVIEGDIRGSAATNLN